MPDTCFMCLKSNIKVQSVLIEDTDGIVVNEKLRCLFPEIIDCIPDAHKLACSECLVKLRISYDFKQSVISNNTVFRDYIEKLQCQHKCQQHLLVGLARAKQTSFPSTRDFTAMKVESGDEIHDRYILEIQNDNLNLTSTNQEINLKTENVQIVHPLIEEVFIKQEPLVDDEFSTHNSDEEYKETEESNPTSSNSGCNDQPKQEGEDKRRHRCNDCPKVFSRTNHLKVHKRIHSGEKPHQCQICHKTFAQAVNLITHELTHTGEKPHQCDVCNKSFNQKRNLITHKRSHGSVRPFQCSVCNKTFTLSHHLTTHIRTHTGEKPYQCQHCKKSFTISSHLYRHMRRLHA